MKKSNICFEFSKDLSIGETSKINQIIFFKIRFGQSGETSSSKLSSATF